MKYLLGEYECRIDSKSRILMPAALKKQIPPEAEDRFIILRGFEQCLTVFPVNVWEKMTQDTMMLPFFDPEERQFIRYYLRGATEVDLDSSNRLLLPKQLLDFAGIDKDVVLFAYSDRFEIWDQTIYNDLLKEEPSTYAAMAKRIYENRQKHNL
jgi:MraZ protein